MGLDHDRQTDRQTMLLHLKQ